MVVSELTLTGLTHDVPSVEVSTVYPVIAVPPVLAGALQLTVATVDELTVAVIDCGALAVLSGETAAVATPYAPSPALVIAATRNVYETVGERLLTSCETVELSGVIPAKVNGALPVVEYSTR